MSAKLRQTILCISLFGWAQTLSAATWEIVPKVGYGFQGSRGLAAPYDRLDFRNDTLTGLSFGYLENDGQLELSWSRSNTSVHVDRADGAPADRLDVRIDQMHLVALVMMDPPPWQPYVLIGAGATRYEPSQGRSTETRFSFALGGGLKWLWNDHLGLRFEGRWLPAVALSGSDFFCDQTTGCYTTESNSYFSKAFPFISALEFTTGLMLRY